MGQQQLLLVVLVVIIVGAATIVAINTMTQGRVESKKSAIRQDILMVLNDAQIYYQKPETMGGGGTSFDGISKNHIFSIDPTNKNGTYQISGSGPEVTVSGTGPSATVKLTATAKMTQGKMQITWTDSTNQ